MRLGPGALWCAVFELCTLLKAKLAPPSSSIKTLSNDMAPSNPSLDREKASSTRKSKRASQISRPGAFETRVSQPFPPPAPVLVL